MRPLQRATCLVLMLGGVTHGQPQDAPSRDATRWVAFQRDQDLADLLDACSVALGIPIEFSRADLTGTVSLRLPGPVAATELWEHASRALVARGFTSVQLPGSGSLSVAKLADAGGLARLEEGPSLATQAGFARVVIPLVHDRADAVGDALKLVLSKHGSVSVFKDTRSILIGDLRPNVAQALRLARQLDASFEDVQVVEVRLEHVASTALTALIDRIGNTKKAVFGDKGRGAVIAHADGKSVLIVAPAIELDVWRGLVAQFDRAEPATTIHYSPRRFALSETAKLIEQVVRGEQAAQDADPWRMVTDKLTGTLVITTTPSRHAAIEALLERIEAMAQSSKRPIRSYAIQNRSVDELHGLLHGLLEAGALRGAAQTDTPSAPAQGATGQLVNQPLPAVKSDDLGDQVILTIDRETNRLIAMGESRVLEQLELLIRELDVRRPQVLVEALVVTLTDSETRSLGVELQHLGTSGDALLRLTSLFGLGSPDPAATALPAAAGTGLGGAVLDPGDFSAVVRALETVNEGRSLTMPKLLVNNNQTAQLNSVLQTPYASTNASTTVATTSFGGSLDAGTQISVTPQIAAGDQLLLDYSISLSSFVGASADPALPPPRQENKLKSVATVPDGFTVVVGGLEIATESKARSSVPILGELPLVGSLFGNRSKTHDRTRFFVFLRCTVMRAAGFEDLK